MSALKSDLTSGTDLPRLPAIEQAPIHARNAPTSAIPSEIEQGKRIEGRERTNYFTSPALIDHLLSGVFETQHNTAGVDAHEPIEIFGGC